MGSPRIEESPEERMLEAALSLEEWERTAISRVGANGSLSFEFNTNEPDGLLRTILNCAKEIRDARSV